VNAAGLAIVELLDRNPLSGLASSIPLGPVRQRLSLSCVCDVGGSITLKKTPARVPHSVLSAPKGKKVGRRITVHTQEYKY
jgi:hypothetical protein